MPNRNDPAHKGEAVDCFRAGCDHGHSIGSLRAEALASRYPINLRRAALLAGFVWEARHG